MSDTNNIGDSSFHAGDGPSSGISLRIWLIGQALAGSAAVAEGHSKPFIQSIVNHAFTVADLIIARLDAEETAREAKRKHKQEEALAAEDAARRLRETWGGESPPF